MNLTQLTDTGRNILEGVQRVYDFGSRASEVIQQAYNHVGAWTSVHGINALQPSGADEMYDSWNCPDVGVLESKIKSLEHTANLDEFGLIATGAGLVILGARNCKKSSPLAFFSMAGGIVSMVVGMSKIFVRHYEPFIHF